MGTVKTAGRAMDLLDELGGNTSSVQSIKTTLGTEIAKYENDPVANAVYYCGGNVVYFANASSELNGRYFALGREIKNTAKYYNNVLESAKLIGKIDEANKKEINELRNIEKYINKSETLKCVASDFVGQISKSWLDGGSYLGLSKPNVNSAIGTVLNKVLYVCSSTTPRYVGQDLCTLVDLYILLDEVDVIGTTDYEDLMRTVDGTNLLEEITDILEDNPRMASISVDFENMTVSLVSAAILSDAISPADFQMIAGDIANAVNEVSGLSDEEQIAYITDSAFRTINQNGMSVSYDAVQVTAEKLVSDIKTTKGEITSSTIENFFEKYSAELNG
jgi:hypothetical protein